MCVTYSASFSYSSAAASPHSQLMVAVAWSASCCRCKLAVAWSVACVLLLVGLLRVPCFCFVLRISPYSILCVALGATTCKGTCKLMYAIKCLKWDAIQADICFGWHNICKERPIRRGGSGEMQSGWCSSGSGCGITGQGGVAMEEGDMERDGGMTWKGPAWCRTEERTGCAIERGRNGLQKIKDWQNVQKKGKLWHKFS